MYEVLTFFLSERRYSIKKRNKIYFFSLPIHLDEYPFDTLTACQEPDLNWWHEDFQSSALPAELSRPFIHLSGASSSHFILLDNSGLCQLKKPKKSYKILPRPWSFLDLQKEDFVSVRVMIWTVNYLIMEIPCLYMFICKYIVSIDLW